ncbi:MAG: TonB-dependent receptor [Mariniphaga sp.]
MKRRLLIYVATFLIAIPFLLQAQNKPVINSNITGQVVDAATNETLFGAYVIIKGITNGSVTNSNGEFHLMSAQKLPFTLRVSYIGYKTREILITEPKVIIKLEQNQNELSEVVISSRRRQESSQDVPIPISILKGATMETTGAFNVNRLKEMVPSVQLYSSNPRNTTLNIRGLGSTFGLTNDGVDPGVGFYIDGVYYARPAATALDFVDLDQVEILRGPQGTLFGKNTTSGAFNITTRAPEFNLRASAEVSYGNYGYIQAKTSITGPLSKKIAGRLSFSGTQRNGLLYNERTQQPVNDLNNSGVRGQLLYTPSEKVKITLTGDATVQKPNGYAQVYAGVVTTMRPAYRQFNQIIADLNYKLPSTNPFDRVIDHDTPWKSGNNLGGISLNIDAKLGSGTLTSTSAWRYWTWDPSNDRDFTGLSVLNKSAGNSKHQQWSQEIRYAGKFSEQLSGVAGVYGIWQDLKSDPVQTEESGSAQWRFAQSSTSSLWKTPGLFDGFGTQTTSELKTFSGAVFGQLDWSIGAKFHLLPGIRFNYDKKKVDYDRQTYGGLQTTDAALLALKNGLYTNQAFNANVDENNFSGQLTFAYKPNSKVNAFLTYANSYKPIGVNLGGLPTDKGRVMTELSEIKPEYVTHYELGLKTRPAGSTVLNFTLFNSDIKDYQTQVQTAEVGVNRGYLANAEKVRVTGAELDGSIRLMNHVFINGAVSYTDGKYITFTNAPVPLEEVGGTSAFKDISGGALPGISKWSGSLSSEFSNDGTFAGLKGNYFLALDGFFRSTFSSSPSPSKYLNIDGYYLLNGRLGFRASKGISVFIWSRNLLNKDYFEQLLPAAGSAGQYAAVLGDPFTYGITMKFSY